MERQELIKKIEGLSSEQLAKVENLVESLANSDEKTLELALIDYATQHAGTAADFDPELEMASVEHLVQESSER